MDIPNLEERYMDVLQNIEFAIVGVHKRTPLLVDFNVENALSALINHYQAQMRGVAPRPARLNERSQEVYEAVQAMCEWRLGKENILATEAGESFPAPEPVSIDVILACLKRVRKSVQRWNQKGGRQGYLTFIRRFIP